MSVIRQDKISVSHNVDEQGHCYYTATHYLYTDDKSDGPIEVLAALGISQWVTHYSQGTESNLYAKAKTADVKLRDEEDKFKWVATINYDTRPFDSGSIANPTTGGGSLANAPTAPSSSTPPQQQQPDVRPWKLKFGSEQTQVAAPDVDKFGDKVRASNDQPYTGLTYDVAIPYFELEFQRTTANFSKIATYTNAVNSDTFFGYLPGIIRCLDYSIDVSNEAQWGVVYSYHMKFQIKKDGHTTKVADEGTYWKVGVDKVKNQDKWSNPIDGAVLLDGAGGLNPAGAAPVVNEFMFYDALPFANIL